MNLKIAHRGASAYEPENTILAFKKAIELGANALEFDVLKCKTGEIVIIHDDTLERTTNGKGLVKDIALSELKKLDAGKGEKIPTLEEVLNTLPKNLTLFIELKAKNMGVELARTLEKAVRSGWNYNNLVAISFDIDELVKIKKQFSSIQIGLTFDKIDKNKVEEVCRETQPLSINLCFDDITKEDIDFAHQKSCKVFVWTVNNKEGIKKASELGADAIMSDYPDLL